MAVIPLTAERVVKSPPVRLIVPERVRSAQVPPVMGQLAALAPAPTDPVKLLRSTLLKLAEFPMVAVEMDPPVKLSPSPKVPAERVQLV